MMYNLTRWMLALLAMMGGLQAQAQISILFVDDSDDAFGNAPYFASALDSLGYTYTYYNAVDSAEAPLDTYLAGFDLVIWHTSTDDSGLWFWNGLDEDNARLKAYLDQGGFLWVVGNDFLFDRYGAPAAAFQAGDFAYEYLGLSSYDVQSYGSDGSLGVPTVLPDTLQPISGLTALTWQFPTLWWADGVSLRDSAVAIYRMGGPSYVLADSVAAAWYDNGSSKVLSFFFDLSLAANFRQIRSTTSAVVSFFQSLADSASTAVDPLFAQANLRISPNPVQHRLRCQFELQEAQVCTAQLLDLNGRSAATFLAGQPLAAGVHAFEWVPPAQLPAGTYLLRITAAGQQLSQPILILR